MTEGYHARLDALVELASALARGMPLSRTTIQSGAFKRIASQLSTKRSFGSI
jgi:hypothetical protein